MGTYINGLRCMPYYSTLPEYTDAIYTASASFVEVSSKAKSITFSAISGGGGGGCGGVHNTTSTIGIMAPAGAGGGGSGYIGTGNVTIANLLSLVGDSSFVSGYEYGFSVSVGSGGIGDYYQSDTVYGGGNGGDSKVYFIKRDASTKAVVNQVVAFQLASGTTAGRGGGDAGAVTTATTSINGANGGAGGIGGRGGRAGYNKGTNSSYNNGANGTSQYDTSVKHYLFDDSNSKIILGKGGTGGAGYWGAALQGYGVAPGEGETSYGSGGKGGDYVGINNENVMTSAISGQDGGSGVVGIRTFFR